VGQNGNIKWGGGDMKSKVTCSKTLITKYIYTRMEDIPKHRASGFGKPPQEANNTSKSRDSKKSIKGRYPITERNLSVKPARPNLKGAYD
jgi:hypothetical protein